jgi:hypothetical protein
MYLVAPQRGDGLGPLDKAHPTFVLQDPRIALLFQSWLFFEPGEKAPKTFLDEIYSTLGGAPRRQFAGPRHYRCSNWFCRAPTELRGCEWVGFHCLESSLVEKRRLEPFHGCTLWLLL